MSRTPEDGADDQSMSTTSYVDDDCRRLVAWSDATSMTSFCDEAGMTSEPAMGEVDWNWRVVPLVALVAAGIVGNTLVCASVIVERRLHNVTNYFLVSLAVNKLYAASKSPSTLTYDFHVTFVRPAIETQYRYDLHVSFVRASLEM